MGLAMNSAMVKEGLRKCPHESCACLIYREQEYCSAHCSIATHAEASEIECDCGHHNCALERARLRRQRASQPPN
jgi:hypothetical protein